jgi:Glycosyl hydrolases family 35
MIKTQHNGLSIDEEQISVYSGAVHYWRLDRDKWEDLLGKIKGMGFVAITSYIPWEVHEVEKNVFDFGETDPRKNIDEFLTLCEKIGLKALVRPGPQINSELTWFGYPRRILEDPEIQARTGQDTKAVLTQVPRPIPALSYTSEKFFEETAKWYDAICAILRKHKAPNGCLIAAQVDNEMGYFFHINPYMADYSKSSIKKYKEFLRKKYQTVENLNKPYGSDYKSFGEIDPPRRFEGKKKENLLYYTDWIEYREYYLIDSLDRLAHMLKARGLDDVPIFHNYPHPLGPGGSVGATKTPFNLPELENKLDFVGFDIYSRKELYDHVKTIISYVVGCSRFPFIPEFIAGVWPWYFKPGGLEDEEFVTKAALMHGIKGFSRYMIVERNKWMGSPVMRDGRIRTENYNFYKRINEILKEQDFSSFEKESDIMLVCNRDYDRLEAAATLISFPGDFLEPILGFSEYPNFTTVSENTFGFDLPIQLAKTEWFDGFYRGLTEEGYSFSMGDTSLNPEKLKEYKVLALTSFEFMDSKVQNNLLEFAKKGGTVILGPKIPYLNTQFLKEEKLSKNLSNEAMTKISLNRKTIGFNYKVGKGGIIQLLELDKKKMGKILDAVLKTANVLKMAKNNPKLDIALHKKVGDPKRCLIFVANPTSETIKAEIKLTVAINSAKDIWRNRKIEIKNKKLVDEVLPYTVMMYEGSLRGS